MASVKFKATFHLGWWALLLLAGCQTARPESLATSPSLRFPEIPLSPSHHRDWSPDLAVLPYAEIDGDQVMVRNIRRCIYESDEDYVVTHYDKQFNLNDLQSVDFIVVPFKEAESLAHTMLSFGFANDEYLAISVEARLEKGERYNPLLGSLRQYELLYVVADERDVILRRTLHRGVDVYIYRTVATPAQSRALLIDVLRRANQVAEAPEFYDTLTNNCTTNIARHLERLQPGSVPSDPRLLLPGYSDVLAYERGWLKTHVSFAETRRRARVTERANRHASAQDFSAVIRR